MTIEPPIIITNFKAYSQATGTSAVNLAKDHERVMNECGVNLAVAGAPMDLPMLASAVSIPVLAQHVDPVPQGAFTGRISPAAVKPLGVDGSLLNHSENRISEEQIRETVKMLRELEMYVVVCAESLEEAEHIMTFEPDYIAIEPPELIGGDVSVSTDRPELVEAAVKKFGGERVIVGAGVKTAEDVKIVKDMGVAGVLVASGVVKAPNPVDALRHLCEGLK